MSPRLLVIEPDAAGRALMERALATGGFAPETAASVHDARACLDAGTIEVAVVDELAGGRGLLDEVRWLRARYPSLPVIVTGTRLAPRTLEELLRLGAAEALRKPFTPTELHAAAARAVARAGRCTARRWSTPRRSGSRARRSPRGVPPARPRPSGGRRRPRPSTRRR